MSEKMKYLLDHIQYDEVLDKYDGREPEVTVRFCGDVIVYRLYTCSDGRRMVVCK